MDYKIRTFIALEVAEKSRQQAFALGQKLAASEAGVKWEPAHKLHITLKFLDEILNPEVHEVCRLVQNTVRGTAPFSFELKGAGAFPSAAKPRTVWVGVNEGREQIIQLAQKIDEAMQTMGFPRELRAFQPHVTLGRVKTVSPALGELSRLLEQYENIDTGKTFARSVTVFASQMARSGSTYTVLATAPF